MNILIAEKDQVISEIICKLLETHTTTCVHTVS